MNTCSNKKAEKLNLCNSSLKLNDKKTPTFEEYLKDKYIHLKYNLYQNRNYRFNKVKKEILKDYNRWRRDESIPNSLDMINPTELGKAIDLVTVELRMRIVNCQREQLFCEKVIHHTCKWFDQYNGCMGCLVKKYEAK